MEIRKDNLRNTGLLFLIYAICEYCRSILESWLNSNKDSVNSLMNEIKLIYKFDFLLKHNTL